MLLLNEKSSLRELLEFLLRIFCIFPFDAVESNLLNRTVSPTTLKILKMLVLRPSLRSLEFLQVQLLLLKIEDLNVLLTRLKFVPLSRTNNFHAKSS